MEVCNDFIEFHREVQYRSVELIKIRVHWKGITNFFREVIQVEDLDETLHVSCLGFTHLLFEKLVCPEWCLHTAQQIVSYPAVDISTNSLLSQNPGIKLHRNIDLA